MTTRLNKTNRAEIVEAIYKASELPEGPAEVDPRQLELAF